MPWVVIVAACATATVVVVLCEGCGGSFVPGLKGFWRYYQAY